MCNIKKASLGKKLLSKIILQRILIIKPVIGSLDHTICSRYSEDLPAQKGICRYQLISKRKMLLKVFTCFRQPPGIDPIFFFQFRELRQSSVFRRCFLLCHRHPQRWHKTSCKKCSNIKHLQFFHVFCLLLKSKIDERIIGSAGKAQYAKRKTSQT